MERLVVEMGGGWVSDNIRDTSMEVTQVQGKINYKSQADLIYIQNDDRYHAQLQREGLL